MWKNVKRWWRYRVAKSERALRDRADPAVQLEQAIADFEEQHRRLREQAATVIANQKQAEMRLNRSIDEYEKLNKNTRQALLMADHANKSGELQKATEYTAAAENFANRLIAMEGEIAEGKALALQSAQAAEQAKAAVAQNSAALQKKLAERQKLLSQLDQAKMQEQLNVAMATLQASVGQEVPSFAEVRTKIEARYAKAKAAAELNGQNVEASLLEIEQASMNLEAHNRLNEMRAQLGIVSDAVPEAMGGPPSSLELPS